MSYLSVSTEGYLLSEQSQQAYIDQAMAAYSKAKIEIDNLLKETYAKLAGVEPINYYAEMVKYDRYTKLSEEITTLYKAVAKEAGKATENGLTVALMENYNRQQYLTNWIAPITATPINPLLVRYTVTGNIDIWKEIQKTALDKIYGPMSLYTPQAGTLTSLLTKNYTRELDAILQSIQNKLITGKPYTVQAKAIRSIIGKYVKKTDKASGAMYNALRIARTEGQRALNVGALANSYVAQGQGIKIQKQWVSTLDTNTRTSHQSLDGQRRELDKVFNSPISSGQAPGQMGAAEDNINCRCTMIDIVDDFEPVGRRARNPIPDENGKYHNEVISMVYYDEWAKVNSIS